MPCRLPATDRAVVPVATGRVGEENRSQTPGGNMSHAYGLVSRSEGDGVPLSASVVLGEPGRPLEPRERVVLGRGLAQELAGVRVHDSAEASRSAAQLD